MKKVNMGIPTGLLASVISASVHMLSVINFYEVKTGTYMQICSIILSVLMLIICVFILPIIFCVEKNFRSDDEVAAEKFNVLQDGFHY
jgi:hypothetical protein